MYSIARATLRTITAFERGASSDNELTLDMI